MKISILIPCYNEEPTIGACVLSCLAQSRRADQIVVVNDGSTDGSKEVLAALSNAITVVERPKNSGSKSRAQEYGLEFIEGDVVVMTDADTVLSKDFLARVERAFEYVDVDAFAGYIKSSRHNWLTACREIDYVIGQDLHKTAQTRLDAFFVIPGCSAAFRLDAFRKYIPFEHDTVTEDLDFTYKLHASDLKIHFDREAVVTTQDPATLGAYIKQMRRWIGGGWENLLKHWWIVMRRPGHAIEVPLLYIEGLVLGVVFVTLPIINLYYFLFFFAGYFAIAVIIGTYAAIRRRRWDLVMYVPCYPFVQVLNSYIFLEQFIVRVVLRRKHTAWFKPARRVIKAT